MNGIFGEVLKGTNQSFIGNAQLPTDCEGFPQPLSLVGNPMYPDQLQIEMV